MMADFLNSSEKRLCILILVSVKYFKKVRIKIPKLRPYFNPYDGAIGLRGAIVKPLSFVSLVQPFLEVRFSRPTSDLYFPTIKVAVEINGRHHYEPIHGLDRFNETVKNDNAVASCCYEKGILLVVFNTSEMGHFSMQKGEQYAKPLLDIIVGLHAEYEQYKKTASA